MHEAVFAADGAGVTPPGDDLRRDLAALVAVGVEILGRPAARAALPGLLAETSGNPALHADILSRFAGGTWAWLHARIERGIAEGEVRAGVRSSTVLELVAGATFVATAIRPATELGPEWVEGVVDVILAGIAP